MNRVILCEGKTDAILLSYFLGKVGGWKHCKRPPSNIEIKGNTQTEEINWYEKTGEMLLICGVGGKDKMKSFFEDRILAPMVLSDEGFSKVAVVRDRDDERIEDIETSIGGIFRDSFAKKGVQTSVAVENNKWSILAFTDGYEQPRTAEVLLVVIPTEKEGALESLLLDAISEDAEDAKVVAHAKNFVQSVRSDVPKYLQKKRELIKAHLSATWAVQYPDNMFSELDPKLRSVNWEESLVVKECFKELAMI